MQYFHSNKSFNQYKPHQSVWQKLKNKRQKKEVINDDLHQPILKNPFKKEQQTSHNKTKLIWILFLLLVFGWAALMLTLPYFKINKIVINGNKTTKATEIEDYVRNFNFSRNNYFLFPDKSIAEKVKQTFLYENVSIKKIFPDTIEIDVVEKPTAVIYDDNTDYYLIDADGKVIKKLTEFINIPIGNINSSTTSTASLNNHLSTYKQIEAIYGYFPIILNNNSASNTKAYQLSPKIIKTATSWEKNLKEQGIGNIQYFKLGDTDFNLKIYLDQPWYLLINAEMDLQIQINNLKIILGSNHPAEYIDLRFGDRVYWK